MLPYRLWPFVNGGLRRLPGQGARHSVTRTELAPAVEELSPEILILPGQEARATQGADGLSLDQQLAYLRPHRVTHVPVLRFATREVFVFANGFARFGETRNRDGSPLDWRQILIGPVTELPEAQYFMEDRSYRYFGHWLRQFSSMLLAEGPVAALHRAPDGWPDAPLYEQMFGMGSVAAEQVYAERFVWYQDFGQGPHKRARYRQLWGRMRRALGCEEAGGGERIYLRRPGGGARRDIVNEAEVIVRLEAEGFVVIEPETCDRREMLVRLAAATEVVSMEGSHVDPLLFVLPRDCGLQILNPGDRFNMGHLMRAAAMGIRPATLILPSEGQGAYRLDPDEVLRTSDLIDRHRAAPALGWRSAA